MKIEHNIYRNSETHKNTNLKNIEIMKKILIFAIPIFLYSWLSYGQLSHVTKTVGGAGMNILPHDFAEALQNGDDTPFNSTTEVVIEGYARICSIPKAEVIAAIERAVPILYRTDVHQPAYNSGMNMSRDFPNRWIEQSPHLIPDSTPSYWDPIGKKLAWKANCANPFKLEWIAVDTLHLPGLNVQIAGKNVTITDSLTIKIECRCVVEADVNLDMGAQQYMQTMMRPAMQTVIPSYGVSTYLPPIVPTQFWGGGYGGSYGGGVNVVNNNYNQNINRNSNEFMPQAQMNPISSVPQVMAPTIGYERPAGIPGSSGLNCCNGLRPPGGP